MNTCNLQLQTDRVFKMEAQLPALLAACLSNDNTVRKQAEEALKSISAQPAVVPALLQTIQGAPDAELRHLAAVLLRKRITRHWQHLPAEAKAATQAILLQRLADEPLHVVRRAIADVAAVVAKHTVPRQQWPELLTVLHQWSQGTSASHKELALTLFSSLAESIGEFLAPGLPTLISIISAALRDTARDVVSAALQAVEPLVRLLVSEQDIIHFHGLVGSLVQCTRDSLVAGEEATAVTALQLMAELVEAPAPLLAPHLPSVVAVALEAGAARSLEMATRETALEVVALVARCKPKQLSKNKALLKQVVGTLCRMTCEPAPGGEAEEQEAGVLTPRSMAAQTLDGLALSVPAQHFVPQVLAFARECATSPDMCTRCGGLTAVAVVCEGAADYLRRHMEDLLPLVLGGMQDPEHSVRGVAAFALGQMSEFMADEMVEHHRVVLPPVFHLMGDADPSVQERACYALDTFCEGLEAEDLAPYMSQLVEKLVGVLAHGAHTSHAGIQEMALSALASIAGAAGAGFAPYVQPVMPALTHFMTATANELLPCRCRAIEVLGIMIEHLAVPGNGNGSAPAPAALGAEVVSWAVSTVTQGWSLNYSELREYGHGLYACTAKALGEAFSPTLATVVPLAITSLEQEDGAFLGSDDDDDEDEGQGGAGAQGRGKKGGALGGISDSDDEGGGGGRTRDLSVRTGVLDEKSAAMHALGVYAHYCPLGFSSHIPPALELASRGVAYFHEDVRAQSCDALAWLVIAAHKAFPPASPQGPPSAEAQQVTSTACPLLVESLEDDDYGVVTAGLRAWKEVLSHVAVGHLMPWLEKLSEGVSLVLKNEAPCCEYDQGDDEEGEEGDDEGGDAAEELLASAGDLLPVLAGAAGADAYAPVLATHHLPSLLTRLRPSQPDGIRGVAVGAIAELSERMQSHMVPHLERLIPLLLKEMRAQDPINRQNAAFAAGVLAEGCGAAAMAPYLPQLLQALHPLFGPKEAAGTRDNAAGCVGRLLLLAPPAAPVIPVEPVLPVLLGALPPEEDYAEGAPVYKALCEMLLAGEQVVSSIAAHVPAMVRAFGEAAAMPKLPHATRSLVAQTLGKLRALYPGQMDPLLAALPQEQQQAILTIAASAPS